MGHMWGWAMKWRVLGVLGATFWVWWVRVAASCAFVEPHPFKGAVHKTELAVQTASMALSYLDLICTGHAPRLRMAPARTPTTKTNQRYGGDCTRGSRLWPVRCGLCRGACEQSRAGT